MFYNCSTDFILTRDKGKNPPQEKSVLNKSELEKQLALQIQQQQILYLNAIYAQQLQASGNNLSPPI